jgi:hypothetical protein
MRREGIALAPGGQPSCSWAGIGYSEFMLTRFFKALFQTYLCEVCRRHEATKGFLCRYCELDQRLAHSARRHPDQFPP